VSRTILERGWTTSAASRTQAPGLDLPSHLVRCAFANLQYVMCRQSEPLLPHIQGEARHPRSSSSSKGLVTACWSCWWQVLGSNQRRRCRQIYRPPRNPALTRPNSIERASQGPHRDRTAVDHRRRSRSSRQPQRDGRDRLIGLAAYAEGVIRPDHAAPLLTILFTIVSNASSSRLAPVRFTRLKLKVIRTCSDGVGPRLLSWVMIVCSIRHAGHGV